MSNKTKGPTAAETSASSSPITAPPPIADPAPTFGGAPAEPEAAPTFGGLPPTAAAMAASATPAEKPEPPAAAKPTEKPEPRVRALKFSVAKTMSIGGQIVTFVRGRVIAEHEVFPHNWTELLREIGTTVEIADAS